MEPLQEKEERPQTQENFAPRPAWQVWTARIGLVLFLIFVAMQMIGIARGGL